MQLRFVVGRALKGARVRRGWTLRDVQIRSSDSLKSSVVGGYERGERSISVERFCDLARLYGVPPERLLALALLEMAPAGRRKVVIDLDRLILLNDKEAREVAELAHRVKAVRGDYITSVISLRSGDVEELALTLREKPETVMRKLQPALRDE